MSSEHDPPDMDDEELERLFRTAGRRRAAPPAVVDALHRSTWLLWRRRRRRRRLALGAAAGLAAAAAILALLAFFQERAVPSEQRDAVAQLEALAGPAWVDAQPAREAGVGISAGALVDTGSGDRAPGRGRARLRTAAGHDVRLDEGSRLRLAGPSRLELLAGALYVEAGPQGRLEVRAPWGVVLRDLGTRFEVRLVEETVRLRVREGRVRLESNGRRRLEAAAGTEIRVRRGGSVERARAAVSGPDWSWILTVGPGFELQGATLHEFLDWVCAETGWSLEAGPGVLDGDPVRLSGSVEGLSPEQAIEAVLPGAGVDWRVAEGRLILSLESDPEP